MSRRKSDHERSRLIYWFIGLNLLGSAFSSYLGYRAIRAMDDTVDMAAAAFTLGRSINKKNGF
jgi:hypothetical protein